MNKCQCQYITSKSQIYTVYTLHMYITNEVNSGDNGLRIKQQILPAHTCIRG